MTQDILPRWRKWKKHTPAPSEPEPPPGGATQLLRMWSAEQEFGGGQYIDDTFAETVALQQNFHYLSGQAAVYTGASATTPPELKALSPNAGYPDFLLYINGTHFASPPSSGAFASAVYAKSSNNPTKYLRNVNNGNFMMEPSNATWIANVVSDAQAYTTPGYDGVFIDTLGIEPFTGMREEVNADGSPTGAGLFAPYNPNTSAQYTRLQWIAACRNIAIQVQNDIGATHPVCANGLINGTRYFETVSQTRLLVGAPILFGCPESFLRRPDEAVTAWPTDTDFTNDVDMMLDATDRGVLLMVMCKVWVSGLTQAQIDQWHRLGVAAFMFGADGSHVLEFSAAPVGGGSVPLSRTSTNHSRGMVWDSAWSTVLGAAVDVLDYPTQDATAYRVSVGANFYYRRRFANGVVLMNPTTTNVSGINLGGTYQAIDDRFVPTGTSTGAISQIDLDATEAAVLVKV